VSNEVTQMELKIILYHVGQMKNTRGWYPDDKVKRVVLEVRLLREWGRIRKRYKKRVELFSVRMSPSAELYLQCSPNGKARLVNLVGRIVSDQTGHVVNWHSEKDISPVQTFEDALITSELLKL
jgi:hypothetical protein